MEEKLISIFITILHSHYCRHEPVFQSHWQMLVREAFLLVLEMKKPVGSGVAEGWLKGRLLLRTQRIWRRWAAGEESQEDESFLSLWHQPQRIGWQQAGCL